MKHSSLKVRVIPGINDFVIHVPIGNSPRVFYFKKNPRRPLDKILKSFGAYSPLRAPHTLDANRLYRKLVKHLRRKDGGWNMNHKESVELLLVLEKALENKEQSDDTKND